MFFAILFLKELLSFSSFPYRSAQSTRTFLTRIVPYNTVHNCSVRSIINPGTPYSGVSTSTEHPFRIAPTHTSVARSPEFRGAGLAAGSRIYQTRFVRHLFLGGAHRRNKLDIQSTLIRRNVLATVGVGCCAGGVDRRRVRVRRRPN